MHVARTSSLWFRITVLAVIILGFFHGSVFAASSDIVSSWTLSGANGAAEKYQTVDPNILSGKDTLEIVYNLHSTYLLDGDASAVIFEQPAGTWRFISLSKYGKNCSDGAQTVDIPLKDFSGLDITKPVGVFHVRFWNSKSFSIDIPRVSVTGAGVSGVTPTPLAKPDPALQDTPTPTPTATPTPTPILSGYQGEYFTNQNLTGTPSVTRTDTDINFLWQNGSPDPKIPSDHFSVRWTKVSQLSAGTYTFTVTADDGFRLYIDGTNVLNKWIDQAATTYTVTVPIAAGSHTITLEYYENAGGAVAKMSYSQISPTPTQTPIQPPTTGSGWGIKSVSSMKETKDKICGQDDANFINTWINKAVELGVNYIAVETPYDNPTCGDAVAYTKKWVDAIHARGLNVWHRHMPLSFEGIYNVSKSNATNYLSMIASYIKNNPGFFAPGDIFTPIPEPQNGGINGVTGCGTLCQFQTKEQFNQWLRDAIDTSNTAFTSIGLGGKMKVGYYGLDGFVVWGDNNPDWRGILEDATIQKMGNITIDHYPELVGDTMANDLNELHTRYPNAQIVIGEWGSTGSTNLQQQVVNSMGAAKAASYVVGFNYWHMGMGGNEALINSDFTNKPQFSTVQSYFKQ